jgi:hypothetical protein
MTEQQKEAVKQAQQAFVAALDAGVEEDALIEAVFEASMRRLETAQPLTDWIPMANGLRYRWVRLSKEEITAIRARLQRRRENKQLSICSQGTRVQYDTGCEYVRGRNR